MQNSIATPTQQRQAGRTLTVVLALVAFISVSALAFGVVRSMSPAGKSSATSAVRDLAPAAAQGIRSGASASAPTSADEIASAAAEPGRDAGRNSEGSSRPAAASERSAETPILAALRRRKEEDQAKRDTSRRTGKVRSGDIVKGRGAAFSSGASAPVPAARPTSSDGTSPTSPPKTPYNPGYVEVLGVTGNTPASAAGLTRGSKILSYNGQTITGREDFRKAWSAPGLPDQVPIVVENRQGVVETLFIAPGNPKAAVSPAFN